MQRSRRALLQRRALEKAISGRNCPYKVSLSLVCVLWGLVFFSSLWISHGDGYSDGAVELPKGMSTWDEVKQEHSKCSDSININPTKEIDFVLSCEDLLSSDATLSESLNFEEGNDCVGGQPQIDTSNFGVKLGNDCLKTDRLSRTLPLGLDEFKSRTCTKIKSGIGQAGGKVHRIEPGGSEYNYASASKGAKVLAFNKEAKSVSTILVRDKDKYLRNPCSAEGKFVVVELSEETLVKTIEIANFEHYSSNLKEFELFGSLVYPTDQWDILGNFTAANMKLAQRFGLVEPKWVRYLKLDLLSHYGSEFYCTLSIVEVYGEDAVERMLEDLIYVEGSVIVTDRAAGEQKPVSREGGDLYQNIVKGMEPHISVGINSGNQGLVKTEVPNPIDEPHHRQVGRMPGDTVLKILMQKFRVLDLNFSVLERYLEELTSRYRNIFKDIDEDIGDKDFILEKLREDFHNLLESQGIITEHVNDLISWKSHVSMQLYKLLEANAILRSDIEKVQEKQISMENKNILVFLVCLIFSLLAVLRLIVDTAFSVNRTNDPKNFFRMSSSWKFLLLSCVFIIFILSL